MQTAKYLISWAILIFINLLLFATVRTSDASHKTNLALDTVNGSQDAANAFQQYAHVSNGLPFLMILGAAAFNILVIYSFRPLFLNTK